MVLLPLYGYGGTEKVLSTIVENIDKNIFDVTFVILDNNKEVRFESQSINVRVIDLELGAADLRKPAPSTRGPEWTHLWCIGCHASGIAE